MSCKDHTEPLGQGAKTGRGAGYCAGFRMPGYMNPLPGRGRWAADRSGPASGGGRGWRRRFYATGLTGWQRGGGRGCRGRAFYRAADPPAPTREQQIAALRADLQCLESSAEQLRQRIAALEATQADTAST
ncbi:MAG: DUF5320 domain-containing protein [Phycisphaerae bacterium]|nr:DUF5320 domain-containing protein [Phycisphaerae bacterium]